VEYGSSGDAGPQLSNLTAIANQREVGSYDRQKSGSHNVEQSLQRGIEGHPQVLQSAAN
jgi:hypothetical protein